MKYLTFCLVLLPLSVFSQIVVKELSNYIGLGTMEPMKEVHVVGSMIIEPRQGIISRIGGKDATQRLTFFNGGPDHQSGASYVTMNGTTTNSNFVFSASRVDFRINKVPGTFGDAFVRLTADGKLGINTTTPTETLDVNGNAIKPGGGGFLSYSDERLKRNISSYKLGLKEVMLIKPVRYKYNEKLNVDRSTSHVGVIAQEYIKINPDAVSQKVITTTKESITMDTDGVESINDEIIESDEYLVVDGSDIKYMLINAIQEQQREIEKLQDMVAILGGKQSTEQQPLKFKMYPNPAESIVSIDYDFESNESAEDISMLVYSASGELILKHRLQDIKVIGYRINTTSILPGQYVVTVVAKGRILKTETLIIQ
ncbi:MAG: tail fiber domain-containing protein [Bacteroidota bacterium]